MVSRWLYGEHSVLSGAGCSCLCCVDSSTLYRPLLSNTGTVNTVHPNEVKLNFLCSFIQRIHFFLVQIGLIVISSAATALLYLSLV